MCETESSLTALQYLQLEISTVVNHTNEEESAAFQRLLSNLLSRPMSPTSPTVSGRLPLPHPSTAFDEDGHSANGRGLDPDVEMGDELSATRIPGAALVSPELHAQRLNAFNQLLTFIDPRAKQPKADIIDLVRSEL